MTTYPTGYPSEPATTVTIHTVDTPTLGDRSYVVHDGQAAFVVDPQRDIDRIDALLDADDVRLVAVFETHLHNDYVTGGLALAARHDAEYYVNGDDDVAFAHRPIADGDVIEIGSMRVTAISTPGHTFTHLAYRLDTEDTIAVFSGGSLLYGATGRPDLLGPDHTEALLAHQHRSAHRLVDELPAETTLLPTHGFGSFCSSTTASPADPGHRGTLGDEQRQNPVFTASPDDWMTELLEGLDEHPAYYAHMSPRNAAGPSAPDLSPPEAADRSEVRRRLRGGEWVVDLRNRRLFAAGHRRGSLNIGIDGPFATYLGWLIPWDTPVTLLASTAEQVAEAQRELVRIGIDRPAAAATGGPDDWGTDEETASYEVATFADLAKVRSHRRVVVLDVRRHLEVAEGRLDDSLAIPLHELIDRIDEVPDGEVWVHCAGGYRAAIAASVLSAAGRTPVAIDDSFDAATAVGLVRTHESV